MSRSLCGLYFGSGLSGEGELGAGDLADWLGGRSTPLLMSSGSVFCSARNSRSADSLCGLVLGTFNVIAASLRLAGGFGGRRPSSMTLSRRRSLDRPAQLAAPS